MVKPIPSNLALYPFMKEGRQSAFFESHLTSQKLGISHREKAKKASTSVFARVFNMKKIVEKARIASTMHGIVRVVAEVANFIIGAFSTTKTTEGYITGFAKLKGTANFPFWGLDTALSLYETYHGSKKTYKSTQIGDQEGVRHHSLDTLVAATSAGSSATAFAGLALELQKGASAPLLASLTTASVALGIISFGAYAVFQAVNVKRLCSSASRLRDAFTSNKGTEEKFRAGLSELRRQIEISPEEHAKAVKRAYSRGTSIREEIENALQKKFNKLERRVGKELALELEENLDAITKGIDSSNLKAKKAALNQAEALMKKYRGAVNKQLTLRVMQVAVGVIGAIAISLFLVNPVSASFLLGGVALISLIAWYGNRYWKDEKFENKNILGLYNNYRIPTAEEVFKNKSTMIIDAKSRSKAADRIEQLCAESLAMLRKEQMFYVEQPGSEAA